MIKEITSKHCTTDKTKNTFASLRLCVKQSGHRHSLRSLNSPLAPLFLEIEGECTASQYWRIEAKTTVFNTKNYREK